MVLTDGVKQRLSIVIELGKTVFHYGFIPTVLYLGKTSVFTQAYFFKLFLNCTMCRTLKYSISGSQVCVVSGFKKGADPGMPELAITK